MRVAFRTDASIEIGNGHVMRCLTLAVALRERGAQCVFICRRLEGHLIDKIRHSGFEVAELSPFTDALTDAETDARETREAMGVDPDWMVVDHYALDARWESTFRGPARKLLVIDDLANRSHNADVLLDHNAGCQAADYRDLLNDACKVFAGPAYALIRTEFVQQRQRGLRPRHQLRHLMISMGGVDKDNATAAVLHGLTSCPLPPDMTITVVMGPHAPHIAHVRQLASTMPWPTEVLIDVDDMAGLMSRCDLAIGAAGISALERCCVGLPSIIIPVADNQLAGARAIASSGGALLASLDAQGAPGLASALETLLNNDGLNAASIACASITKGTGAAVLADLMGHHASSCVRRMQASDLPTVLTWRNAPEIRRWMLNPAEISAANHEAWFRRADSDPDRAVLIAEAAGLPFGFVQFSSLVSDTPEWGFYVAPDAPKGSGKTLGQLALRYAFETLGLTRLIGRTLTDNGPSIRFHEKFGFRLVTNSDPVLSPAILTFELLREEWELAHGVFA